MRLVLTVSLLTLALAWGTYLMLGDTHSRLTGIQELTGAVTTPSTPTSEIVQLVRNTDTPSSQGSFSDAMKRVISKNNGITQFVARDEEPGSVSRPNQESQVSDSKKP